MKKTLIMALLAVFCFSTAMPAYASDWDKAGIALTGIEGIRILTGGRVDLIGSMFGINRQIGYGDHRPRNYGQYKKHRHHQGKRGYRCSERVWVPHYTWRKEFVPRHEKYDPVQGKVIVEGHYVSYQVEDGGHWETKYYCGL